MESVLSVSVQFSSDVGVGVGVASLKHVQESDSDVREVEDKTLRGLDDGVSLGVHVDGSDMGEVVEVQAGVTDSEVSLTIQTSAIGLPVAPVS